MKHQITVFKGSDQIARIPFDGFVRLDGYTAKMQIRSSVASEEVLDELTTENGRIAVCRGFFELTFPHEVTSAWSFRRGVFDIKAVSPNGGQVRMAAGRVLALPEVTR